MTRQYVFGPIASRRLGVSLGIDLVKPKTCSLDCVYCEARATTLLTTERREYVPVDQVLDELDRTLAARPKLDWITFSGSGEPTLNSGIGRVVDHLKSRYPQYRVCLLTNATLLGDPKLREEIADVDLVVPSLDGSDPAEFAAVNRPAPDVSFSGLVDAITSFSHATRSQVKLELFIVPGVNDSDASIARFVELIKPMRLDLVWLNTLDRPGTVSSLKPSDRANTLRFVRALEPVVPVEAVGPFSCRFTPGGRRPCDAPEQAILSLIVRRPATVPDLAIALGEPEDAVQKRLDRMYADGLVAVEKQPRGRFYLPADDEMPGSQSK